ncbi:MAG: extracellular solute-binding protein [Clostridia bacterium]|nr:extracellular solute-binding protein [Clostridia bacterium]
MRKSIFQNKFLTVFVVAFSLMIAVVNVLCPMDNAVSVSADSGVKEITVFSWEDYIDEGYDSADEASEYLAENYSKEQIESSVIDIFMEENPDVKVNYYSFATNEEMYNELLKDPTAVDLICPSEYMIMKMRDENLIKPYKMPQNYIDYGSPYIKGVFEQLGLNNSDGTTYAIGYMWGTMGLIYNAEREDISDEDFKHWANLFDEKFKGKITIKDSLRDSYIMAVAIVHEQLLLDYKEKLNSGEIDEKAYTDALFNIFNDTSEETVHEVRDVLVELKRNLFGFEVDAGKNDLLSGKIDVNFAWSGDAVYSMWEADEAGKQLRYVVPEEGSNVWFDGWVMTKDADEESALKFLNFLSRPDVAVRNMDYVGYTSCIGGDTVFDYVSYNFDEGEGNHVDLKYFFDPSDTAGKYQILTTETNRHLYAQYADEETIMRCAVMDNFSVEDLELVNEMWNEVKLITFTNLTTILIVVGIVLIITAVVLYKYKEKIFGVKISDKDRKIKKGLKIIKKENIV